MYERFTVGAKRVMGLAQQAAHRCNHEFVGTEHVLLGLVQEGYGVAGRVLECLDVDRRKIRFEVEKLFPSGPDCQRGELSLTPRVKKAIQHSMDEARHNHVGTEHLLLALVRDEKATAAQVLMNLGIQLDKIRKEVLRLVGNGPETLGDHERDWII